MKRLLYASMSPFYPDFSGGAELSILFLLQELKRRGWQVEVFCSFFSQSSSYEMACRQAMQRQNKSAILLVDNDLGFPCRRLIGDDSIGEKEWRDRFAAHLKEFQPDIVLGYPTPSCPLLNHALQQGYPCFFYAHNLAAFERKISFSPKLHIIANAPVTAAKYTKISNNEIGLVHVVVDRKSYEVPRRQKKYITFINPIPEKGIDIALKVARHLIDRPFLFVKGGWPGSGHFSSLNDEEKLPNVDVWEYQHDMRSVYSVTDVLFMPSQFFETFGRVIVEAHINGIPVVAADVGGIAYAMGKGGILVRPKDDHAGYVKALEKLEKDRGLYRELSNTAVKNSKRPEFDPSVQVDNFIQFVTGNANNGM